METLPTMDIEEKKEIVGKWIKNYSETGVVEEIDSSILRDVLESCGANFENLNEEGKDSLGQYSNKRKHKGMLQVWGEKAKDYRDWCGKWVEDYEKETGETLPFLKFKKTSNESKTEGMRAFFGEITAFAAGIMEFETIKERLGARLTNFRKSGEDRKKIIVKGYNNDEPFAPASIPPGFAVDAYTKILSL